MWQHGDWVMGTGHGWWWGWSMPFGGWFLLFLVILFVVLMLRSPHRRYPPPPTRSAALDLLEQRYARGEIGRDEYLEKRRDLGGSGQG